MQLFEQTEVFCKSEMFNVAGVIDSIFPDEHYGIQALMNDSEPGRPSITTIFLAGG